MLISLSVVVRLYGFPPLSTVLWLLASNGEVMSSKSANGKSEFDLRRDMGV
jgi:hypothetical protein